MTNPEQVATEGPDWPAWRELYISEFNRRNPYWMTRLYGRVYELNSRPTHRVVFRYEQQTAGDIAHTDFMHKERTLSIKEIQAQLPDLLMEWLL